MARTICEICGKLFIKPEFSEDDVCEACRRSLASDKGLRYNDE